MEIDFKSLIKAIDEYIEKADGRLEDEFKRHGMTEPEEAVKFVGEFEERISNIRERYPHSLTEGFSVKSVLEEKLYEKFLDRVGQESLEVQYADTFHVMFEDFFSKSLVGASEKIDRDIEISEYTKSSKEWLADWSHELADILKAEDEEAVKDILKGCLEEGKTIEELTELIQDKGVRTGEGARRLAKTEAYRCNNYAKMEAMLQNPSVIGKTWVHAGGGKPRENHLNINGVTVGVNDPFVLEGADGNTYYPMMPHDVCLPVGEVANCGCVIEEKKDKKTEKKSPEEKAELQRERIKQSNDDWEREFNERNKKASGVDFDRVKYDWVKKKTPEEQIKYFGGGHSGKARKALIDSKVIKNDEELNKLYKRGKNGKRQLKTLTELKDDGIITVDEKALKHSSEGEYKNPSKKYPNGRLYSGGHAYKTMDDCKEKGIEFEVVGNFTNGVVVGNVPSSRTKIKQSGNGQLWFPESWSEDDILEAGTFAANDKAAEIDGNTKVSVYKNVRVKVIIRNGKVMTICPDYKQDKIGGVKFDKRTKK